MSKAKLVITESGAHLEVDDKKIENLKITADNVSVIYPNLQNKIGAYYLYNPIEPVCYIKGKIEFEFEPCTKEDFKYIPNTITAPQIATQIEEKSLKIFKLGQKPVTLMLPQGYWKTLIDYYSKISGFITLPPNLNTWRGLKVLENGHSNNKEIVVISDQNARV